MFAVGLAHAGPYPFPRGMDLAVGAAKLLGGLLLAWHGRAGTGGSRADLATRTLLCLAPLAFLRLRAHLARGR